MARKLIGYFCILTVICWSVVLTPSVYASSFKSVNTSIVHRPQAPLASCSKTGCNDLDPYATGCAGGGASWKVVASAYIYINGQNDGYTQLWWSNTCQKNWARTVCTANCTQIVVILNINGYNGCNDSNLCISSTSQDARTKQRYLPSTTAQACGGLEIHPFQGNNCTGFFIRHRP